MSIAFSNYSISIGKRYDHEWYDWCIFASGDEAALSQVKTVEYTLHPSFPDPVRISSDCDNRFAVMSNGWGGFVVDIRVTLKNAREEYAKHLLRLDAGWPIKKSEDMEDPGEQAVYSILTNPSNRWRTLDGLQKRTGMSVNDVLQVLKKFENLNLARKSPIPSIGNKDLWGATAVVGIAPKLQS